MLFHISRTGVSRSLSRGLTILYAGRRLHSRATCCQVPAWEPAPRSAPGSLNHRGLKANTVHESITSGEEMETTWSGSFPYPSQTTNLSDSQIISNLLDLVEKEISTLIIHSQRGLICVRPHWCTQETAKRNAQMKIKRSHPTISIPPYFSSLSSHFPPRRFMYPLPQ